MPFLQSNNVSYLSQVAQTVDALVFVDQELDESLAQIKPDLAWAYGLADPALLELDPQASRFAMASALGLVAALTHIRDSSDLERLMLSTRFIDDSTDHEELLILKSVALDKTLQAAVEHAALGRGQGCEDEVLRMTALRARAREILSSRGCAGPYFAAATACSVI